MTECYACKNTAKAQCKRCNNFMCNSHKTTNQHFEDGNQHICLECDAALNSQVKVIKQTLKKSE